MPEVVVATPDTNGKPRDWNEVFPIWNLNVENTEWKIINQILEAIAINNRFGSKTPEELANSLKEEAHQNMMKFLSETEKNLAELPNPEANSFGLKNPEEVTEAHKKILDERMHLWASYGKWQYYIREVFTNLAGAYREYK